MTFSSRLMLLPSKTCVESTEWWRFAISTTNQNLLSSTSRAQKKPSQPRLAWTRTLLSVEFVSVLNLPLRPISRIFVSSYRSTLQPIAALDGRQAQSSKQRLLPLWVLYPTTIPPPTLATSTSGGQRPILCLPSILLTTLPPWRAPLATHHHRHQGR